MGKNNIWYHIIHQQITGCCEWYPAPVLIHAHRPSVLEQKLWKQHRKWGGAKYKTTCQRPTPVPAMDMVMIGSLHISQTFQSSRQQCDDILLTGRHNSHFRNISAEILHHTKTSDDLLLLRSLKEIMVEAITFAPALWAASMIVFITSSPVNASTSIKST